MNKEVEKAQLLESELNEVFIPIIEELNQYVATNTVA